MSAATPITVIQRFAVSVALPNLNRFPSALSASFQYFFAMYSLTTATRPVTPLSAHSCCVNMRPRSTGIFSVSRYRGDTQRISSSGSLPSCVGWFSTMKKLLLLLPPSGMLFAMAALTTPGRALSVGQKAIPEREALVGRIVERAAQRDAHA